MPGGQKEAYELVADVLEEISAKAPEDGAPCVTYIGPNGAGHYVKMVHNGIEYGDMQLIAESYDLMQHLLGFSAAEMADIFTEWNKGELDSYLIEITADILTRKDDELVNGRVNQLLTLVCRFRSLQSLSLRAIFLLIKMNVWLQARFFQNQLHLNLKETRLN